MSINFWTDAWCGAPLVDQLNIPCAIHSNLKSNVTDFIHNLNWSVPITLANWYPNLPGIINLSYIPLDPNHE